MYLNKVCRSFSKFSSLKKHSENKQVPFSRKRQSLFYIKYLQQNPPPTLKSIYRKYLKLTVIFYKTTSPYIGEYLIRLLQKKKENLKKQYENLQDICKLIQEVQTFNYHSKIKHEKYSQKQNNLNQGSDQKKTQPLFHQKKINFDSHPSKIQANQIKLTLQKDTLQTNLTQKILENFDELYHLSKILQNALNLQIQMDLRTKNMSKLVRLSFNASQFFTPTLSIRQGYHSLVLLDFLEDDMEFQVLSEKDKQFVREVVQKVCGPRKLNHSRYRTCLDYLKDTNAVINQEKFNQILISKKQKKRKNQENQNQDQENDEDTEQFQLKDNEWSLMSMKQRNQAVRKILAEGKQQQSQIKLNEKSVKMSHKLKKNLLFEILYKTKVNEHFRIADKKLQKEIYQIVRRLFKLVDNLYFQANQSLLENQVNKEKMKHQLLQDAILENQFLDEFINQKKIIIV